ncbi:aspartyl/glutamyl-tRNA amidotransferase subunit A [bacterium]|nr:aspartyl/glutamyl-tRNA amidotransferase subunit A [bacterium]
MKLNELTAYEISKLIRKGEVSSEEVTKSVFERIEKVEKKVGSFVTLMKEGALKQARIVDEKIKKKEKISPLAGIPIAIKDNMCIDGVLTTCSSKMLENFKSPYDATVIKRLKENDLVFIGKTNMDEFAMGSSTENSAFKITHNPWNLETIPGGSSGGSAAAVASDEAILALGSDTGGSIRQPASLCGVVGLKPTYGRVSRYGLVAFASSLDQIGSITKDVTDSALLMNVISGYDERDSTSCDYPVPDYTKSLVNNVKGMKIGIPKEYFIKGMDEEVEKSVKDAIKLLEKLGAQIKEVSLPHTKYAVAVYYLIATAEASSNLARYEGVKYGHRASAGLRQRRISLGLKPVSQSRQSEEKGVGISAPLRSASRQDRQVDRQTGRLLEMYEETRKEGFGDEVKRRIMLGTYALSAGYYDAYYLKAQKVRTLVKEDIDKALEKCDCLITPTSPTPSFKIGEKINDPLKMYLSDIFTISTNLAWIPGISVPCGFTKKGLPIGLQILAKPFAEETILKVAYTYEQNTEWHKRKPPLVFTRD